MNNQPKEPVNTVKKKSLRVILASSEDAIQQQRASRVTTASKMSYDSYKAIKKKEIFKLEDKLDIMSDISTSNSTQSMNAIGSQDFDEDAFVATRCDLLVKIKVLKRALKVIEADSYFYE